MAKSKRQMTQAKRAREQALRERRERKQEKKRARAEGTTPEQADDGIVEQPGPASASE